MQHVAVVTDSTCCLPPELVRQYGIDIIPLIFTVGGKSYRDLVDITPNEAYQLFLAEPESFKTSAPSPEEILDVFRKGAQRAKEVLYVTLSTYLSSTYNSAQEARELARTELPGTKIEILDSNTATPAEGFVALAGARADQEGKNMAQVIKAAERVRDSVEAIIALDTIRHVYRSGRIPKIASQVGSIINIRPILTVSGKVHFAGAARNRRHGIERMLEMMREKVGGRPVHVAVTHAYAPEEAEELKQTIAGEFLCTELWIGEFSPIMGYACGTGTVGVSFYTDD